MDISEIRRANLIELMTQSGMKQNVFAEKVGTAPAYISQIINCKVGRNGKPAAVGASLARKIEKSLLLPHGYMDSSHEIKNIENKKTSNADGDLSTLSLGFKNLTEGFVPVLKWNETISFSSIHQYLKDTTVDEWLPPSKDIGENGYGLIVTGYSMSPKFEPNDRIYIEPDFDKNTLKTGDLVIVQDQDNKEVEFRELVIENNRNYFQSINQKFSSQIMNGKILGKVVGLYRKI